MPPDPLGILIVSGHYDRVHAAFMLAAAAAAIGRTVTIFATGPGVHALAQDWSALLGAGQPAAEQDGAVRSRGVAGIDALRDAALELGIVLQACDSALRVTGLTAPDLLEQVEVTGMPAFLSAIGPGQIATF